MAASSSSTSMSDLNNKNQTTQGDESDSCFEFIKRRHLGSIKTEHLLAEAAPFKQEPTTNPPEIKIVNVKPISQFSATKSPIKPVATLKSSPLKHRIDAIAENLKALQEQKKINNNNVPKVGLVVPKVSPITVKENKLKNVQLSQKELAHQLILLRCNKKIEFKTALVANQKEKSMDDVEMDDDLTNLDWLTTFNLSKNIGIPSKYPLSLSPPNTPSSPISPLSSHNNTSLDDDNDDEADSNHLTAMSLNKDTTKWSFIPRVLKPEQLAGKSKPPYSFSCLTFLAIESSQRKRLSVKEIYNWITNNFPYYSSVPSGSWKNSIRHNLSMNKCFSKVDKNLLAMRDFSGKGSLWCTSPEARPILLDIMKIIEKSRSNDLHRLMNAPYLQDINEPVKQASIVSPTPRISKNRSSSSLNSAPMTIINPRLTQKLGLNQITKVTQHKSLKSPQLNSDLLKNNESSSSSSNNPTDLDAVNALLSMKSRASSMPVSSTLSASVEESPAATAKPGRRKQVFKPPMKKPHINPKLLDKTSNVLYYGDIEDEEEEEDEIDEEFEEEDEEEIINELIQDDEFPMSKQRPAKKLQIKFPSFVAKKSVIVTMSDDDNDEFEENKLEIDESHNSEESNESNLEPGEIRKPKKSSSKYDINRLLELSRAASLVEDTKESLESSNKPRETRSGKRKLKL